MYIRLMVLLTVDTRTVDPKAEHIAALLLSAGNVVLGAGEEVFDWDLGVVFVHDGDVVAEDPCSYLFSVCES